MSKFPGWSHSTLTAFETCPKQYYHLKVAKDVKEEKHVATTWGTDVHTAMENKVRDGTPMPAPLKPYEPLLEPILAHPGQKLVEQKMAIDEAFKPVDWRSNDAWCRGIVDAGVLSGTAAVLLDWKTGKRKTDSTQLKLFAGLAFAHYPELLTVTTGFVWLKANAIDKAKFTRSEIPMIWGEFAPRVVRMQRAFAEDKFPPKPNGLCQKWCSVPNRICSFSGKK